jgi:ribosomal protein L17
MDEKLIAKNFVEKLIESGKIESVEDACKNYQVAVDMLTSKPSGSLENLSDTEIKERLKEVVIGSPELLKEIFKEHPELFE